MHPTHASDAPRLRTFAVWLSLLAWLLVALCAVGVAAGETVEVPTAEHVDRLEAERDRQLALLEGKLESLNHRLAALASDPQSPTSACCVSIADAEKWTGLATKPNDPNWDNGPAIQALLDMLGSMEGQIHKGLLVPAGAWHCQTALELPVKTGVWLFGVGTAHALPENRYRIHAESPAQQHGGPASRLIYHGSPDVPFLLYAGVGLSLERLVIQRSSWEGKHIDVPKRDGSVGFALTHRRNGVPSGKAWLNQLAFLGWDTAIETYRTEGQGGHADNVLVGLVHCSKTLTFFRNRDPMSMGWTFQQLNIGFPCEVVFDLRGSANVRVSDYMVVNPPALVIRHDGPSSSGAYTDIRHVKFDRHAEGWRLLEQRQKSTMYVRVRGHVSNGAKPADDWLSLVADNRGYNRAIDVRLRHNWRWLAYEEGMPDESDRVEPTWIEEAAAEEGGR